MVKSMNEEGVDADEPIRCVHAAGVAGALYFAVAPPAPFFAMNPEGGFSRASSMMKRRRERRKGRRS